MDIRKNLIPIVAGFFIAAPLAAAPLLPPVFESDWTTVTSLRDVRMFGEFEGGFFAATSGGMVRILDPTAPGEIFDNINGFGTVDIFDFLVDANGEMWTVGFGRIIRNLHIDAQQFLIADIDDKLISLHSVADDGDVLWVGADRGLLLFSKTVDGGQILDSYTLFGDLNPSPTVNDVLITGDSIWLATSEGLATADRSDPVLLKAPATWTTFDLVSHPELGSESITRVVSFEGDIYVATPAGFFRFETDSQSGDTTFNLLPLGTNVNFANIVVQNDSMFCFYDDATPGGMAVYKNGQFTNLSTQGLPSAPKTGFSHGGRRWVALLTGGIYYSDGGSYSKFGFTGPPANRITGIVVDDDGTIDAGFGRDSASYFSDGAWSNVVFWVRDGVNDVARDDNGAVWFATEGNGWWRWLDGQLKKFDQFNSTLRGTDAGTFGQSFIVIKDAAFDDGWVFVLVREPFTNYPVAFVRYDQIDSPSAWDTLGPPEGITDKFVTSIDYADGKLAVATVDNGIFFIDVGLSPSFKEGYKSTHYREGFPSFLLSNSVRVVRFDPDGVLWAGTNFGLCRYEFFEESFVPIDLPPGMGPDVTTLEFDVRGNAWIGCKNGLARIDAVTGKADGFTTLNSDIVNDEINALHFDTHSGRLFVGTQQGMSILTSQIGTPTINIDSVIAFPNPFVIRDGSEMLQFNYLANANVSIHSVAGELIAEFTVNDGWDGRNGAGDPVASGVYIWVMTSADGTVGRGKILLVRK